jgi:hypothetical protein
MILTKKQINDLPYDTCEQLLDILYIIEDQLSYKCKSVSATINYLQDELHPAKEDEEA